MYAYKNGILESRTFLFGTELQRSSPGFKYIYMIIWYMYATMGVL